VIVMERRWLLYALAFVITSSVSGVGASPRRYRFPAAAPPTAIARTSTVDALTFLQPPSHRSLWLARAS